MLIYFSHKHLEQTKSTYSYFTLLQQHSRKLSTSVTVFQRPLTFLSLELKPATSSIHNSEWEHPHQTFFSIQISKSWKPHCPWDFRLEDTRHFTLHSKIIYALSCVHYNLMCYKHWLPLQSLIKQQALPHSHNINDTEMLNVTGHYQTFHSKAIHRWQAAIVVAVVHGTSQATHTLTGPYSPHPHCPTPYRRDAKTRMTQVERCLDFNFDFTTNPLKYLMYCFLLPQ